jgi:serine/threonine-protein kinase
MDEPATVREVGRYALCAEIAAGGMATVHLGRLLGPVGFAKTVAIKKLHPQYAKDPEFVSMFLDEARLAARIQHPNVVSTLDVVALEGELFLVMEYVQGESLSRLLRASASRGERPAVPVAVAIAHGALRGLHAAHEARSETGAPLAIIHRDVSPQNVLVGEDGVPRVLDFGVAKAAGRLQQTRDGQLKGKIAYMAPEQLRSGPIDRRVDVYAVSVMLWEVLALKRAFEGENELQIAHEVLAGIHRPPSRFNPLVSPELDAVVMKGCDARAAERFATAHEMAEALEHAATLASPTEVSRWVSELAAESLSHRAARVAEVEGITALSPPMRAAPDTGPRDDAAPAEASSGAGSVRSQATDLALSTSLSRLQGRLRRNLVLSVAAGAVVGGTLVAGFLIGSRAGPSAAPAVEPTQAAPSSDLWRAAGSTALAPSAMSQASQSPLPSTSASATASASTRHKPGKALGKVGGPWPSGADPRCDPPYVVDARGVRRFKPECL